MLKGILAGLAAGALWGMVFVVPRMTPGLSSVDLTAGRFISFGVMSALSMAFTWTRHQLPSVRQGAAAIGMSLLGATGYYLLLALAIGRAGTEVPTLIVGTIPLWLMLLGKPLGLKWSVLLPGLLLTATGMALMMNATLTAPPLDALALAPHAPQFWSGVALASAAMLSWTAFAVLNAAWLKRHPQVSATEWTNWLGVATGVGAGLLWLVAGSEPKVLLALEQPAQAAIICIVTGVGAGWAASILWNIASRRLSVSLCGQLIVSETLFALLYSFVWAGAWPGALQWAAAVLFTLGILASIRAHR
ncbi:MAG: DMT family transporter [Gammaproteobacteria bacterium]|uniref:DMT family transporter n=1 Tax=Rhodoferax sp. TaxID=50421 RepID=UPI00181E9C51|nr:DMT family transporter [Rhodoferax sp.]MBU3898856.1 DMT family transporter [Gammaproteobacteria bacterium]MBA3059478.1 DMT family transporter [Rhodoferax sp.]MBU3999047.1 DMT family transporter [Gammaproteobacteria bacterium]MBU4019332.1 DMT family transporter [Gammaproteobacteria bacterium]MBU4081896.1 DMT family transporter [Gammaproteobacteria bacterium]